MKKVIALLLAAVMVFALCACGQQGAEGKDPAAKLPEFKLGIPMENTANPAQYSYLENMVYLCGNFPNGGTAVAEADDLTDPDHMISSVEKLISAGCRSPYVLGPRQPFGNLFTACLFFTFSLERKSLSPTHPAEACQTGSCGKSHKAFHSYDSHWR